MKQPKPKMTDKEAIKILKKWTIDRIPQYRGFICGGCGKTIRKAWHIHCFDWRFRRELHLCAKCGRKWDL